MTTKTICDICGKEIGKGTNNRGFIRIEEILIERDWGMEEIGRNADLCSKECALKYLKQL